MLAAREMLSVGIDIGTTTTQVIFSKLTLVDVARPGQISRIEISAREVIHESPVVFTPLADTETIDVQQLRTLIQREYTQANITPAQVETGAVIITGETAKKKNADEIIKAIADMAGDFVVTVAGPHVESMIAGRGSGAASYSRQHFTTVTNIDIGGGSSNSAIFRQGNLLAAAAMNFGGRVVEIERSTGCIRSLTQPARIMLEHLGLRMHPGDRPGLAELRRICDCMAELTVDLIEGTASPLAQKLYLTEISPVSGRGKMLMFSGGIGYYYYAPIPLNTVHDVTVHDDVGPLLAQSLLQNAALHTYSIVRPAETLRATVLGASTQMVALSGSTIWTEEHILPLKNVPVVRPSLTGYQLRPEVIVIAIRAALLRWDLNLGEDPFAVNLDMEGGLDYAQLVELARGLASFAALLPDQRPLIVIIKHDYAQALGLTLKSMVGERPLLVIDQVGLEEGDYIDIGVPLLDGRVVPLIVKTLIFYH